MSYNGSGTFSINSAGQPVVTGTVISSTAFNALTADLATGLSTAITKDGQTTTTARILFAQGVSSTLVTDATSATTGSIITAGGISMQKALWVGTTSRHVGAATFDAAITYGGVTLSNAVTGTGSMVLSASPTLTGTLTAAAANFSGIVKSTGGTGGGTSSCFVADAANAAYSWKTSGAGSNANIWDSIVTSASSTLAFRMVNDAVTDATNWISVTRTGYTSAVVTLPQPINYGGVTLSNSVTGTGSMVLSASPTFTGTVTAAAITASGLVTGTAGFSNGAAAFGTPNTKSPTRTATIANNGTVTINTQLYGVLYVTEDLATGDSALIGASQVTAVIWQKAASFSATSGTAGKYNVYVSGGVITIENKSGSNARFAVVNLMGPS